MSAAERTSNRRQWRTYVLAAAAIAFGANWIWEMAHMPAYREMESRAWLETVPWCTAAALADVILTFIPYFVGAAIVRNSCWAWSGGVKTYVTLAALGFVTAVIGEYVGLQSGKWSYNEQMPIVPGIEVGAWPVLQLTILVPLAFAAGNFRRRRVS